jgi:hypothetical protein
MSLGHTVAGYEPYSVGPDGKPIDQTALWVPVDVYATSFFNKMSVGAFSTDTPLKHLRPRLARQAGTFRLHPDAPNASNVALTRSMEFKAAHVLPTPLNTIDDTLMPVIGDEVRAGGRKVVIVDTVWRLTPGTYDKDSTLRIAPTQVQLIAGPADDPWADRSFHQAIGAAKALSTAEGEAEKRIFIPFNSADAIVSGTLPDDRIAFVFTIPADQVPEFALIRQLRVPIVASAEEPPDPERVAAILGKLAPSARPAEAVADGAGGEVPPPVDGEPPAQGTVGDRGGPKTGTVATGIEVTAALPEQFSTNQVQGNPDLRGNSMLSGHVQVPSSSGARISPQNAIKEIYCPSHMRMIRVLLEADKAQSLLGRSRTMATMLQGIWLTDRAGNEFFPTGWAWSKKDGSMEVKIEPAMPIRSARELPIAEMNSGEKIYLYFSIPPGTELVQYSVGTTKQDVTLSVPR